MNTDAILDFVVENYIWFIIGGVVIILAILGVIAEKKKIVPKKKKKEKKEAELIVEDGISAEKISTELKNENEIQNDMKNDENVETIGFEQQDNKLEIFEPSEINGDQDFVINNKPVDIIDADEADVIVDDTAGDDVMVNDANVTVINNADEINDANISDKINYVDIDNEIINEINSRKSAANSEVSNDETSIFNNQYKNPNTEFNFESLKFNQKNEENKLSDVDADINKINSLNFSDDESKDEEQQKNEEKLEDTMQISYSQLKEIVQDIIAENELSEKDNGKKENIVEKQEVSSVNDTTSKEQSEQNKEDDVWKF